MSGITMRGSALKAALASLALVFGVAVAPAEAKEPKGFYIGLGGGINTPETESSESVEAATEFSTDYNVGWVGRVWLGYDFGMFRMELEPGYRSSSVSSAFVTNNTDFAAVPLGENTVVDGDQDAFTVFLNGFIDFEDIHRQFVPYIGAGIGYAHFDYDGVSIAGVPIYDDGSDALAFQGIAGVKVPINRNLSALVDYRYMLAEGQTITDANGNSIDVDASGHTIMLGLSYTFAKAEKPMIAEPAPEPEPAVIPMEPRAAKPEPFLVFFDWDSAEITPEAARVIRKAAEQALESGVAQIRCIGHADRSGPVRYNQELSENRARAVKNELILNGIEPFDIAISGRGESDPLVDTPDGVREAKNRRVEVIFE